MKLVTLKLKELESDKIITMTRDVSYPNYCELKSKRGGILNIRNKKYLLLEFK